MLKLTKKSCYEEKGQNQTVSVHGFVVLFLVFFTIRINNLGYSKIKMVLTSTNSMLIISF